MSRYQEIKYRDPARELTLRDKVFIRGVTIFAPIVLVLLVLTAITYRAEIWELMKRGLGL